MPRGYRSAFVAIGLIVAIASPGLGQEEQPQRNAEDQEARQEASEDHDAKPGPEEQIAAPVEAPEADPSAENAARDHQNGPNSDVVQPVWSWDGLVTSSDTFAQWIMALFGVVATGVSVYAVIILRRTLEATRDAIREAEKSTKAALQAAKEAEYSNTILRAEQRPWLTLQRTLECTLIINSDTNKINLKWSYKLRNHGKTPALEVLVYQKLFISNSAIGDPLWVREVIDAAKRRAETSITTLIIFPSEATHPYNSMIGQRLDDAGDNYYLIVCLVYRGAGVEGFGVEARVFSISEDTDNRPRTWKLLEHQRLGVIE